MATNPIFPVSTLIENLPTEECWLTPAEVAALTGLNIKWLADAREGRKNLSGPQYVKIGKGRTSPIRYSHTCLIAWMSSFQLQTKTTDCEFVSRRNFTDFSTSASATEKWLFSVSRDGMHATDVFEALKQGKIPAGEKLRWLSLNDYMSRRFVRREILLSNDILNALLVAGSGDLSAGLEVLIRK
jgi:hypothetical protein